MTQTAQRLLLVDDDERNLKLLKVRLHPLGHELSVAHDGHAAIAAFEEMRPDLALLDVVMPGLDGLEVLKHIRRSDHDMHVPVILVTGHSERDRGLQAGAEIGDMNGHFARRWERLLQISAKPEQALSWPRPWHRVAPLGV